MATQSRGCGDGVGALGEAAGEHFAGHVVEHNVAEGFGVEGLTVDTGGGCFPGESDVEAFVHQGHVGGAVGGVPTYQELVADCGGGAGSVDTGD